MTYHYLSDTHFEHANIIRYSERPFESTARMRTAMWEGMAEVDASGDSLVHAGDFTFRRGAEVLAENPTLRLDHPERHQLVLGNHDDWHRKPDLVATVQQRWFTQLHGTHKSWRTNACLIDDQVEGRPVLVLVSHRPQADLQGADLNLYGHLHNTLARGVSRHQEDRWAVGSAPHFNVSVELIDYHPISLTDLLARRAAGVWLW